MYICSIYMALSDLGDSSNPIGSLSRTMTLYLPRWAVNKAKQNRGLKLGVLAEFQSKKFLKIQECPSVDDSEGKKRLHGV